MRGLPPKKKRKPREPKELEGVALLKLLRTEKAPDGAIITIELEKNGYSGAKEFFTVTRRTGNTVTHTRYTPFEDRAWELLDLLRRGYTKTEDLR